MLVAPVNPNHFARYRCHAAPSQTRAHHSHGGAMRFHGFERGVGLGLRMGAWGLASWIQAEYHNNRCHYLKKSQHLNLLTFVFSDNHLHFIYS